MPKYQVILTRDITTSAILDIVADTEDAAKDAAINKAWNCDDREIIWEPNDVDWTQNEPLVTDIVELA